MSSITADGDDKLMFRMAPAALGLGILGSFYVIEIG
jgi:hypothetical protein